MKLQLNATTRRWQEKARCSSLLMQIGVFHSLDHAKLTLWENLDSWILKLMEAV